MTKRKDRSSKEQCINCKEWFENRKGLLNFLLYCYVVVQQPMGLPRKCDARQVADDSGRSAFPETRLIQPLLHRLHSDAPSSSGPAIKLVSLMQKLKRSTLKINSLLLRVHFSGDPDLSFTTKLRRTIFPSGHPSSDQSVSAPQFAPSSISPGAGNSRPVLPDAGLPYDHPSAEDLSFCPAGGNRFSKADDFGATPITGTLRRPAVSRRVRPFPIVSPPATSRRVRRSPIVSPPSTSSVPSALDTSGLHPRFYRRATRTQSPLPLGAPGGKITRGSPLAQPTPEPSWPVCCFRWGLLLLFG